MAVGSRAAIAALAVCALAVDADVAAAHFDYVSVERSTLLFQRFPDAKAADQLTITYRSDGSGTYFVISDPTSTGITNFPPCSSLSKGDLDVRCPANGITQLLVNTRSGDNSITINAPTPAKLYGGSGNDTMRGGSGTTQFFGQAGNDTLIARSGANNVLIGGTGRNVLNAKNGIFDTVYVCPGIDSYPADSFDRPIPYCPKFDQPEPFDARQPTVLGLTAKSRRILKGGLVLGASATKPGTLVATATVSVSGMSNPLSLRRGTAAVPFAGVSAPLTLKASKGTLAALRQALSNGQRLRAKVLVHSVDVFGARSKTVARQVRLTT
jgi:hypothetical protein